MSILNRLFQRKREMENGKPDDWEQDEVFVRAPDGRLIKLDVPDSGGEDDAPDNKAERKGN